MAENKYMGFIGMKFHPTYRSQFLRNYIGLLVRKNKHLGRNLEVQINPEPISGLKRAWVLLSKNDRPEKLASIPEPFCFFLHPWPVASWKTLYLYDFFCTLPVN